MREIVIVVVSALVGLVLGGFKPRAELAELEARYAQLEARPCESGVGRELAEWMGRGGGRTYTDPVPTADFEPDTGEREEDEDDDRAPQAPGEASLLIEDDAPVYGGDDIDELDAARTALDMRRAQARAALLEQADPDPEQIEDVDVAVDEMNESLMSLVDEISDIVEAGEEPSRLDAMSFAADALDIMIETEERMLDAFDDEQLDALEDDALNPFFHVDSTILDRLESGPSGE